MAGQSSGTKHPCGNLSPRHNAASSVYNPSRKTLCSRGPVAAAFPKAPTIDDAQRFIEDSNLLDARRFMHLFPDAKLERERAYGFTKSLIAVR